ncbi:McrC family protein [Frankia sp. Cr1]|uniref:McrC family protein n=1 Tax=Frankia sp. Cr1 TaxID=3073931 RepID=UPI002AD420DE|nr:restriction endonuclease [Frankia sp. Cr1]
MPDRIILAEYRSRTVEGMPAGVARALAATGAVTAGRDMDGRVRLTASSMVGLVRAGDVELVVQPKVGVGRLLWLLGHARNPSGWRDDDVTVGEEDDLVAGTAVAFAHRAGRALTGGILRGYRSVDEASPILRGRLREADQMRARLGVAMPLEVRYDDYTVDIPENRILATAARRLLRLPGVPVATRAALHRIHVALSDVTPLVPGGRLPSTVTTRLTRRYEPALRLARLVLASRGIEVSADPVVGRVAASGLLFDMNAVYEDWLTAAFRGALEGHGGAVDGQRVIRLDEAGKLATRPDITWWRGPRCLAVTDAKYKAPATTPIGDIYQVIAYCTALGLSDGHLVYAGGASAMHTIRRAGIRVHVHVVDLAQTVPALVDQIDTLAAAIATQTREAVFAPSRAATPPAAVGPVLVGADGR